jgi:hypothetical protein
MPDRDPRLEEGPFAAQNYYDLTFDFDAEPGRIGLEITQVIKVHRPQIPLAYRETFQQEATARGIMKMHPGRQPYEIIKKMWWEKDWGPYCARRRRAFFQFLACEQRMPLGTLYDHRFNSQVGASSFVAVGRFW